MLTTAGSHEQWPRAPRGVNDTPKIVLTPMLDLMVKDVKPALLILSAAVLLLFAAAIGQRGQHAARAPDLERSGSRDSIRHRRRWRTAGSPITRGDVNARVLTVAIGVTMAVSLIIGLLPARMARGVKLTSALVEEGSTQAGSSLRSSRSRALIVTGQVAIAFLLLVGARLLSQSLYKLINIDRGYEPEHLLTARIAHFTLGQPAGARSAFYKDVLDRLSPTPGVTHAALSDDLPITARGRQIAGSHQEKRDQRIEGEIHVASLRQDRTQRS